MKLSPPQIGWYGFLTELTLAQKDHLKPKDFHSRKLVTFEYDIGFDWHNFWVTKDDITLKTNGNLSRPL